MSISAVSSSYVSVYPALAPSKVSAPPGQPLLPAGVDRVKHATEQAQIYAGTAELETSRINDGIASYNHFSDENMEKYIEEIKADKRKLESNQRMWGDGWEQALREHGQRMRDFARRTIEISDLRLRMAFNVRGSTHTYDPKTGTYARGAFTASVDLGDSAVRFDSRKGPEISIMGAAFTANFTRNAFPRMGSLDYEFINPDELEAVKRRDAWLQETAEQRAVINEVRGLTLEQLARANKPEWRDVFMKKKLLDVNA